MLRMIQNRAAASAKSYYSHGDYYAEGQELAGRWGGKAATQLGLSGVIRQEDFDALCDNLDPRSGSRLTARTRSDRSVGYDINMHLPKGASLAYAIGGDERILDAFQASVRETMADIEQDAKTRVRVGGRQENRHTGNLVWGEFIHKTARPVDGIPDPHLHAHCFVFNATYDAVERRFKAVQFRQLKQDAGYYEARFHARMALRMKQLGYVIERTGRYWDVADVSKDVRDLFSRRKDQIDELANELEVTDPEGRSALVLKTREQKQHDLTLPELRTQWSQRLREQGGEIVLPGTPTPTHEASRSAASRAVAAAFDHCFERNAVVPERDVIAEALRRGLGDVSTTDIAEEAIGQGLITRDVADRRLATTPQALTEERAVVQFVSQGRNSVSPLNASWQFQRSWLSAEQQRGVRQLVSSRDRVQVVHGRAGTGKTTLMQEAADAVRAAGHELWTFAPSAAASRGVLREAGFDSATTVAELLVNESLQAKASGQVWWIDEASLLPTRQLKELAGAADAHNARVILSGDWRQHGSVERGGLLRQLVSETGIKAIELKTIRRQEQLKYRDAVRFIADGDVAAGFRMLDEMGWIEEIPDDGRDQRIAADFADAAKHGKSCLVVSPTHAEAAHITSAIRACLRDREFLGDTDTEILQLRPLHLTTSERGDAAFYQEGDVVEFHQNVPGHKRGERMTLSAPPPAELLAQAKHFNVYRRQSLPVAPGDRLRFTANVKSLDGQHRIHNGNAYSLRRLTGQGDLELNNGWIVSGNVGHIAYGYVTTSHSSQGQTVDRVILAESTESLAAAGAEQFYVSVTRGRKEARIYTDDKPALLTAIQEVRAGMTASELLTVKRQQQTVAARFQARERLIRQPSVPPVKSFSMESGYVPAQ